MSTIAESAFSHQPRQNDPASSDPASSDPVAHGPVGHGPISHVQVPIHPDNQRNAVLAFSSPLLSRRVLVVDDNALIAMDAEAQLFDLGAETVDVAHSVASAITLIASNVYEFALLDVNLGHETSRRAADALSAAGVPFAFLTGYGEIPWSAEGNPAEHVPIVDKPLDPAALKRAVVVARAGANSRQANGAAN